MLHVSTKNSHNSGTITNYNSGENTVNLFRSCIARYYRGLIVHIINKLKNYNLANDFTHTRTISV